MLVYKSPALAAQVSTHSFSSLKLWGLLSHCPCCFYTSSCRAQSLLVLGKPGTGKTTLLRDIARIMSTPPQQGGLGLAVLIVDTSNEIAGGGG
jgi:predicted NACHT family NTPase